jgi:hypothetical protein
MSFVAQMILSDLDTFNEEWVQAAEGVLTRIMRRDALNKARAYLFSVGILSTVTGGLQKLEEHSVEIQNCRPPSGDPEFHLELRLRMFALVRWLLDNNQQEAVKKMAMRTNCPEITDLLNRKPIT